MMKLLDVPSQFGKQRHFTLPALKEVEILIPAIKSLHLCLPIEFRKPSV